MRMALPLVAIGMVIGVTVFHESAQKDAKEAVSKDVALISKYLSSFVSNKTIHMNPPDVVLAHIRRQTDPYGVDCPGLSSDPVHGLKHFSVNRSSLGSQSTLKGNLCFYDFEITAKNEVARDELGALEANLLDIVEISSRKKLTLHVSAPLPHMGIMDAYIFARKKILEDVSVFKECPAKAKEILPLVEVTPDRDELVDAIYVIASARSFCGGVLEMKEDAEAVASLREIAD